MHVRAITPTLVLLAALASVAGIAGTIGPAGAAEPDPAASAAPPSAAPAPEPTPAAPAPAPSAPAPSAPAPEPTPTAPSASPSSGPSVAPSVAPPPPGATTQWSSDDGKAPSQAWFDAYQRAVTTPANGQNVLLPWESPSGQVQVGQGTAVTGGWSVVDASGNAGQGISCGSVCASGWFPTGFGSDGRPTTWVRVVQQTSAVDGNAVTGPGRYTPDTGWTVPGPSGTHQWNWQTNSMGPCVADCPTPEPPTAGSSDGGQASLAAITESIAQASSAAAGRRPVAVPTATLLDPQLVAAAADATRTERTGNSGYRVVVRRPDLAPGSPVTVILTRGKGRVTSWEVAVGRSGQVTTRIPGRAAGTVVLISGGQVIGVSVLKGA